MNRAGAWLMLAMLCAWTPAFAQVSLAQLENATQVPCRKPLIRGIWRLISVQETPLGAETKSLQDMPFQYYWFNPKKQLYGYKAGATRELYRKDLAAYLLDQSLREASQFVLTDTGLLYIYKKSIAVDGFRCTIVQKPSDNYKKGDMLLTPLQAGNRQLTKVLRHPRLQNAPQAAPQAKPTPKPRK